MVVTFRSDELLALGADGVTVAGAFGFAAVTILAGGVMGTVTFGCRVGDGRTMVEPVRLESRGGVAALVPGALGTAATLVGQRDA